MLAVVALLATSCLLLEPTDPGPLRFRDEIFSDVTRTNGIVYGQNTSQTGATVTLALDFYEPAGDTAQLRPLIIWVHGGSFSAGNRASPELVDQATVFGRKGYTSASISYRLSAQGCTVVNAGCIESIVDATEDAQAAVRFFRANADTYRIDPDRIAIAGSSAGGITAMNVGFGAEVPGNSGNPGHPSDVEAAVSLSGARLLGTCDEDAAPAMMFHNEVDPLVPYDWAANTKSCADDGGTWARVRTFPGTGHVPYVAHRTEIIDVTTTFLFNALEVRELL